MIRDGKTFGPLLLATLRTVVIAAAAAVGCALLMQVFPGGKALSGYAVFIGMMLAVWIGARFLDRMTLRELGLAPASWSRAIRLFLGGGLLALASTLLMAAGMIFAGELEAEQMGGYMAGKDLPGLLTLCVVVGLAEELLFRGHLVGFWRRRGMTHAGIAVSALLFSAMHAVNPDYDSWLAFAAAFAIGLFYGYIYDATGNLWMPIGHHIVWNFTQALLLPPQGGELAALIVAAANFLALLPLKRAAARGRPHRSEGKTM